MLPSLLCHLLQLVTVMGRLPPIDSIKCCPLPQWIVNIMSLIIVNCNSGQAISDTAISPLNHLSVELMASLLKNKSSNCQFETKIVFSFQLLALSLDHHFSFLNGLCCTAICNFCDKLQTDKPFMWTFCAIIGCCGIFPCILHILTLV